MALVINTNVASLGAQRTLNQTTQALQRNIEKLSSGYRVNRAADDAAGLGISENLRASIKSLAQANVIRRREESNATRSLLNTAKLIEDNPTLMRLKELEALEKVTEKIDKLTVFGGLEGVMQNLVKLKAS